MAEDYSNAPKELVEARIVELEGQTSPLSPAQEEDLKALKKAAKK
jgi:hypothetical protein